MSRLIRVLAGLGVTLLAGGLGAGVGHLLGAPDLVGGVAGLIVGWSMWPLQGWSPVAVLEGRLAAARASRRAALADRGRQPASVAPHQPTDVADGAEAARAGRPASPRARAANAADTADGADEAAAADATDAADASGSADAAPPRAAEESLSGAGVADAGDAADAAGRAAHGRRGGTAKAARDAKAGSSDLRDQPWPDQPGPGFELGRVLAAPDPRGTLLAGRAFGLALDELAHHVTTLGATGSGKTTTLGRFLDAALEAGWSAIVLDAKGGRLADFARAVAARHDRPARVWLPGDPDSWSYDVCAGEPTAVANRLVGAFEHGREGEIYRNLSQAILPLVGQALVASGFRRDLDTLRRYLDRDRLVGLSRRVPDPALGAELLGLDADLYRRTLVGLSGRLAALRHGTFGPWLVPSPRTLDLAACLAEPGVTYFGLPATGASEDVALVGRVLVQHLKQLSYGALRAPASRRSLIVVDEFASLGEASQLVDLLLQAREARLAVVVSSQFVPRAPALRHAVLGAGALVVHQLGSAEDADLIARTLGTRTRLEVTRQLQLAPTASIRRLLRPAAAYLVSPEDLRRLAVGQAVVSIRHGDQRLAIVQIEPLRL